jgi:hypothetical protein
MMMFLIICTIGGILLGLRFKVFVLVPTILVAAGAIIMTGNSFKVIALTLLATVALLQIGYVAGCVIRAHVSPRLQQRMALRHRFNLSH